ncbi:hypothetical protein KSP39_PZI023181 [Platanthera zijinensis]|uniref:TITAN-like protein n=1 Tax=Platanthera zijinensis TaxID=2320716 RepID=A0AAP0FV10_9ASPA
MRKPQKAMAATTPTPASLLAGEKARRNETTVGTVSFEFCQLCNLNHDQGRRHKYFPSHVRAVTNALSRFQKKLSEIRFFILNPSLLRPEHAAHNRIWCVFCALDIDEIGGYFVCGNAIRHMAGEEHLRNLKRFLLKHAKGIHQVDSFKISEEDLLKWEKKCEALRNAASSSSVMPIGPVLGPSKDIQFQHELNSIKMDYYSITSFSSNVSHPVLPLQSLTNENYRVCSPSGYSSAVAPHIDHGFTHLAMDMHGSEHQDHLGGLECVGRHLTGAQFNHVDYKGKGELVANVMYDHGNDYRESNRVLQMPTRIALPSEGSQGNVHTGDLPPWLETSDEQDKNLVNFGLQMNNNPSPVQKGKSKKLNPKRVGAAWADKRRIELEMEKKGEIFDIVDANWLPNFGRVWQTGTRKESRKEFEIENHQLFKDGMHLEASLKLQPYISKRMVSQAQKKRILYYIPSK